MMNLYRSMPARKRWRSQRPMLCKLFHRPIQSCNMPPCLADDNGLVALGWQVSMLYITAVLPQASDCQSRLEPCGSQDLRPGKLCDQEDSQGSSSRLT